MIIAMMDMILLVQSGFIFSLLPTFRGIKKPPLLSHWRFVVSFVFHCFCTSRVLGRRGILLHLSEVSLLSIPSACGRREIYHLKNSFGTILL